MCIQRNFKFLFFEQITNQLVQACKEYIQQYTHNIMEDKDELWDRVAEEVLMADAINSGDPLFKSFNKQVENKLRVSGWITRWHKKDAFCLSFLITLSLEQNLLFWYD